MNPLRDLPIQRKMLAMTLLICGAVLCVAIAALFAFQVFNFRSNFQRDAATLAVVTANNSAASMAFGDDKAATEVVGALKAEPNILAATLLLPGGRVFAHYGREEDAKGLSQFPPAGELRFAGNHLLLTQPVEMNRERFGTLCLRLDYRRTFLELLHFHGLVILGIMIVAISLAGFLSDRLGGTITDPVLELARTAQIIGATKDYSVRAIVGGRSDELGSLTTSFNDMLNRIQQQDAALSRSQEKLEALINSIDGIVWERAADTFRFTFISRQSEDILGYAPASWVEEQGFWQAKLHPQDAAKAAQTTREMLIQGQPYSQEYRMIAADGRTVWIRESGTVLVENKRALAARGIFQDVTQSKLDAEQLDKLNRQLLDTNRRAGMAEVATGVLHNVGNILNSVGVSATVVGEKIRSSKIDDLCRAASMLGEQNGQLAHFLTADPRGKLIPKFIAAVADQVAGEQAKLAAEMTSIGRNIEHIKEIVAMQQSYAKVSGAYENHSLVELVEDALRMNSASFERHSLEVVREFDQATPMAFVDRHKVLQILINLLRNAKHALDNRPGDDKRIVIRVGLASPGSIQVTVRDNGIGIPPENMTKIFNHGFTTKKHGHGFGLHSGANAAKEMGGSLRGQSDGTGKGAEFTLELPVATPNGKVARPAMQETI